MAINFQQILQDVKNQQYSIQEQNKNLENYKKQMGNSSWKEKINTYFDKIEGNINISKLDFDSIIETNYESSAEISEVLLENGAFLTSNYKKNNASELECEAVISRVGNIARFFTQYDLIYKFQQFLKKWKEEGVLVEIQTKSNTYRNLTLIYYNIIENFDNFNLFRVKMRFKQVLLQNTQETIAKRSFSQLTLSLGLLIMGESLIK